MTSNPFTHLRGNGSAHMVDVTTKTPTVRVATAECCVVCSEPIMTAPVSYTHLTLPTNREV